TLLRSVAKPRAEGTEPMNRVFRHSLCLSSLCLCVSVVSSLGAAEPWSTARGNPQRTGCTDGKAGPETPKVLWVYRGNDNYVAAPLPFGDRLYVAALGGLNVPSFRALNVDPAAKERVAWAKTLPALRLPSVSSPAVADGKL